MADVTFANAAAAYANGALRELGTTAGAAAKAGNGAGQHPSFAEMVGEALANTREANLTAENQSMKAIQGQASLHEVVAAVSNAEIALQTVIAVRDRVISAYQEIMRMPI